MVLVNYQQKLKQLLQIRIQQSHTYPEKLLISAKSQTFYNLLCRIYQYCQELNMIQNRQRILRKQTKDIIGIQPQLFESEVQKVKDRTKQIGQTYSLFLLQQPRFKTKNSECIFYQNMLQLITSVLKQLFSSEDFFQLRKQIHRLFRTNTFNTKLGYQDIEKKGKIKPPLLHDKIQIKHDVEYSLYRKDVKQQISDIKPYLHNRSCFKTKQTRSPVISLLHPTTQYLVFNFERKTQSQKNKRKV